MAFEIREGWAARDSGPLSFRRKSSGSVFSWGLPISAIPETFPIQPSHSTAICPMLIPAPVIPRFVPSTNIDLVVLICTELRRGEMKVAPCLASTTPSPSQGHKWPWNAFLNTGSSPPRWGHLRCHLPSPWYHGLAGTLSQTHHGEVWSDQDPCSILPMTNRDLGF